MLLFGGQSGVNWAIAGFILITILIFVYQNLQTYKFVETSAYVLEVGSETVSSSSIRFFKYIYRHLYRLQVYLLEPIFSGYLLAQIFSGNQAGSLPTWYLWAASAFAAVSFIQTFTYLALAE